MLVEYMLIWKEKYLKIIRNCKPKKNRQNNGQKKKDKQLSTKNTQETKD